MPSDRDGLLSLKEVQRAHLLLVLEAVGWNRAEAARILDVNRKTVYRMIARFGLDQLEKAPPK
jgi:transcriptional regulator of acetoin/glycerol metabolism